MIAVLEEDWGLDFDYRSTLPFPLKNVTSNVNSKKHSFNPFEKPEKPEPKTQCDCTFWGELINIDILHKTKNKSIPLD
jgi:hypothetical protein